MSEQVDSQENNTQKTLEDLANESIRFHVYGSLAVGLIPLPFVDFVGVGGIQLDLLKKLSEIYEVPFSKDMVKNLIGALAGATVPSLYAASMSKFVPIIQGLGVLSASAIAGASTYAVGKVFARHFSEGGTFLTFDPEKARAFYAEMFKEGQDLVKKATTK